MLSNVAWHAQADRVIVELEQLNEHVLLKVLDNGRGISTGSLSSPKSLGLLGMHERARRLGGEVQIKHPRRRRHAGAHSRSHPARMSAQPLHVLHLEDNPLDAELVRYHLEAQATAAGEPLPQIVATDNRPDFEAALTQPDWDLILADYRLPSYDGLSALRAARTLLPETPFIFVTGELGEERAIETLQQGATDYVLKTRLGRLGPSVARARRAAQDRTERRGAAELALSRSEGKRYRSLVEAHRHRVDRRPARPLHQPSGQLGRRLHRPAVGAAPGSGLARNAASRRSRGRAVQLGASRCGAPPLPGHRALVARPRP